jgi:RNA polymerase sigma-70 factor (ECF subfamily)
MMTAGMDMLLGLRPHPPRGAIDAGFAAQRNQVWLVASVASHQSEPRHDLFTTQDRDLLRLCLANAPGAWEAFVSRFSGLLAFVAERSAAHRGVSLTSADRDDLVAEVMVEILRNDAAVLRAFAGRASLPTFLTVVARRVCVRSLLRARKKSRGTTAAESPQPDTREDHAAAVANRDQIETLLQRLDPQVARLVRLHHLEGRSYGEISRLTGMPLGSIGPALSLARQQMRDGADHEHKPATG